HLVERRVLLGVVEEEPEAVLRQLVHEEVAVELLAADQVVRRDLDRALADLERALDVALEDLHREIGLRHPQLTGEERPRETAPQDHYVQLLLLHDTPARARASRRPQEQAQMIRRATRSVNRNHGQVP